ncbi:MAG: hypothetical protein QM711_14800 [Micropruina sp.]
MAGSALSRSAVCQSVHAGHHHVHQNAVRTMPLRLTDAFEAVRRRDHAKPVHQLEGSGGHLTDVVVVVH